VAPRATGIGGIFFRSRDPAALQTWYREHLGLEPMPDGTVILHWRQADDPDKPGSTVWAPFAADTDYFGTDQAWMINYRVDDLDATLAALRASGASVDERIEVMEGIGRFGWAVDPEGNRFELWEPAEGA
jgi:catechol 2,3-dioxygenase-like lactoylglutathione lyase family enzyme